MAHKGERLSDETRMKMRESHLKRLQDPEARRRMEECLVLGSTPEVIAKAARSRTGLKKSVETRRRISESNKRRYEQDPTRADCLAASQRESYRRNPHRSEAVRRSNSTRIVSEDTREKISKAACQREGFGYSSSLEDQLAKIFDCEGIKYKRHQWVKGLGRHQWDFALYDRNMLVEVDGCYWHSCPSCGLKGPEGQRDRDLEQTKRALDNSWRVMRIPEHDFKSGNLDPYLEVIGG